jgi:hypothetical protein
MILYKYTSLQNGLKILLEKRFRYTQPICFNDPFELYPIIEEYYTEEQLDEMLDIVTQEPFLEQNYQAYFKKLYNNLTDEQKSLITFDKYYPIQKGIIEKELEKINIPIRKLAKDYLNDPKFDINSMMNLEYLKNINSIVGILSLSSINNDILMWSHYTKAHTGVVLKINTNNSFFSTLSEVNYPEANVRPIIKLSKRDYSTQESIELYKKIFFSKSRDWHYEKEYRDMKPLLNGYNTNELDESGMPKILFEFPPEIIEGVIFGLRVNNEMIVDFYQQIINLYNNLKYEKVFLDPNKYEFAIHEIEIAV